MSEPRELRCYEYVIAPYERVCELLAGDPTGLFQRATRAASARADELGATLRVAVGPIEIGAPVNIRVVSVTDEVGPLGDKATRLEVAWTAAKGGGFFPSMEATLRVYPLSRGETQIDLHGKYRPPLGAVGNVINAVFLHRVAEATVLRFVQDLAARINAELASGTTP